MWVRSQDKSAIVNIVSFNVVKGSSKGKKGFIYGHFAGESSLQVNPAIIGRYTTYDDALKEMDNIEIAITENQSGVYQVR